MKPVLAMFLGLACVAGLWVFFFLKTPEERSLPVDTEARIDGLSDRLTGIEERLDGLARRLEETPRPAPSSMTIPRENEGITLDAVRREIAAALAKRSTVESPAVTTEIAGGDDLETQLARLNATDLSGSERQQIWSKILEMGKIDEAIAFLEDRAENASGDPEAQTDLGEAYIMKLTSGNLGYQETGELAMKADGAYDRALKLDGEHWRARFNKASSLAWWPPQLGKQGAAVKEFQTLINQQAGRDSSPQHAQTHMMLGNLYQQMGKHEKAKAAWQEGSRLFPNDKSLRERLENADR